MIAILYNTRTGDRHWIKSWQNETLEQLKQRVSAMYNGYWVMQISEIHELQ